MTRKFVLALSLLALPLATVVAGTTANASVRPKAAVTFKGSVTCSITGAITAKPPLLLSTKRTTTIGLRGTATDCKGKITQHGVTLVTGKISGKIVVKKEDCLSLTKGVPNPVGTIKWTGKGGFVKPTAFTLSNGSATFGTKTTTITFTSKQTGSFKGTGKSTATVHKSENQLIAECQGSGVSELVVASGTIS